MNENNMQYGIKGDKLKTLTLDIMAYRDKIAKILDDVEMDFYNCSQQYKSADGSVIYDKMKQVSEKFENIINKFDKYVNRFETVLQVYKQGDVDAAAILEQMRVRTIPTVNSGWGNQANNRENM